MRSLSCALVSIAPGRASAHGFYGGVGAHAEFNQQAGCDSAGAAEPALAVDEIP